MMNELLAIEKRAEFFLALVPLVGPLFIKRSEWHTREEKRKLSALSIGLMLVILAVAWSLRPSAANQLASLHRRIESEMHVLGGIAEQYRKDHGSYPDEATWKRFTERTDKRFFDPWGRPYLYQSHDGGITLQTLGQDGLEGGSGKDADVTFDRPPPTDNPAAPP